MVLLLLPSEMVTPSQPLWDFLLWGERKHGKVRECSSSVVGIRRGLSSCAVHPWTISPANLSPLPSSSSSQSWLCLKIPVISPSLILSFLSFSSHRNGRRAKRTHRRRNSVSFYPILVVFKCISPFLKTRCASPFEQIEWGCEILRKKNCVILFELAQHKAFATQSRVFTKSLPCTLEGALLHTLWIILCLKSSSVLMHISPY